MLVLILVYLVVGLAVIAAGSRLGRRGVTIGVVGTSNIVMSDIRTFRTRTGLPASDPKLILSGSDPGLSNLDAMIEAGGSA